MKNNENEFASATTRARPDIVFFAKSSQCWLQNLYDKEMDQNFSFFGQRPQFEASPVEWEKS